MKLQSTTGHAFVNTFTPLCRTVAGQEAIKRFGLPPFIDGSIRREPDLEHPQPSISCLCRAGKFAPRLKVDDHVLYLTQKGCYGNVRERYWRLVAVLRVKQIFKSHEAAAKVISKMGATTSQQLHGERKSSHRIGAESPKNDGERMCAYLATLGRTIREALQRLADFRRLRSDRSAAELGRARRARCRPYRNIQKSARHAKSRRVANFNLTAVAEARWN
jgi:hypothetical protein